MSGMHLFLVDAIGPFFRTTKKQRTNWSKIPFETLPTGPDRHPYWEETRQRLQEFARRAQATGFNAITLDDLAHLTPHPWYEPEVTRTIEVLSEEFRLLFSDLKKAGLRLFITSDVLTMTPALQERLKGNRQAKRAFYFDLVQRFFETYPEVDGLILRLGESDGLDIKDPLRSELFLRNAKEANAFLRQLIPLAQAADRTLILRTWTVGAHRLGDLIWNNGRIERLLSGIDTSHFILSMKPGESDFFRHLRLNKAFFSYHGPKILELQARPEYEGAGELPTFLGSEFSKYHDALQNAQNVVGLSVWVQTGGWHRFRRLTYLNGGSRWVEINAQLALHLFAHNLSVEESLQRQNLATEHELLALVEHLILTLYYIRPYAEQTLYFRRVRLPPLLHAYWDTLFVISPVRKLLRHFVVEHQQALEEGEISLNKLPHLMELAQKSTLPAQDLEFLRDTLQLIGLARRYYFTPYDPDLVADIRQAKKAYKKKWPLNERSRYRIRTDFRPFQLRRRSLRWVSALLLRKKSGYRLVDYVFSLTLLSFFYRLFKRARPTALPEFVRQSAMGVDTLFK